MSSVTELDLVRARIQQERGPESPRRRDSKETIVFMQERTSNVLDITHRIHDRQTMPEPGLFSGTDGNLALDSLSEETPPRSKVTSTVPESKPYHLQLIHGFKKGSDKANAWGQEVSGLVHKKTSHAKRHLRSV